MSKANRAKRKKNNAGAGQKAADERDTAPMSPYKAAFYAVLLSGVIFGGWSIWQAQSTEAAFLNIANAHKSDLGRVQHMKNLGRGHLTPGQGFTYPDRFPTSGPHAPVWTTPGMYTNFQPDVMLVHALEHGNIVIYYDRIADDDFKVLEEWAGLYSNQWSGIVVMKRPGLGDEVVLTAWTKMLRLKTFDAGPAAAFVDAYRGRGPEHPVR